MLRPRLVELVGSAGLVVVEAPSGAGKSTLLAQLAAVHDGPVIHATLSGVVATRDQLVSRAQRSLRLHGLSELGAAVDRSGDLLGTLLSWSERHGERLLIQIDDLHLADHDLDGFVADLCDRWQTPHRLVLAGRRVPDESRACLVGTDSVFLDAGDLRLQPDEAREVLGRETSGTLDDGEVARITARCDGWPAAVDLAGARLRRAALRGGDHLRQVALDLAQRPSTVLDLLGELLAPVATGTREAVAQLALLPAWDDQLVRVAGIDGGVAELVHLGLPIEDRGAGWWVFPNVVREALGTRPRDPHLARAAAARYVDAALPEEGLAVLAAARLEEDLAELLADLPRALLGQLDAMEHAAAVATLPEEVLRARPRILIHLADSYVAAGHTEAYAEAIGRAVALLGDLDPCDGGADADVLEVRAADLTMRAVARNDDELVVEAEALLARPELPPMARGRLLAAIGRATASRRTAASLRIGARRLDEAARAFDREGAPSHAVASRVIGATFASIPLGRYDVALEQLDRALAIAPGNHNVRVAVLPYRAFVLVDLGRYAEVEAVLDELRRTASTVGALGNERAAAFARWAAARMASQRGDGEATWAACRAVERSDVPVDTGGGAFFRADAAQLLARVGWFDDAERLLADARGRDDGRTGLVTVAEFVVAAHLGDLARADAMLARLDGGQTIEPRDRWRVTLLHAAVCHRAGDPRAGSLAAAAFEEAAQLGYPNLPLVQEPATARELLPVAARGSASARDLVQRDGARIRLLGGFEVERAGERTEPSGRPGQLIAFLALHDRRATVDQAIEALWPEGEPGRGRERLRTVLRRVRRDHGHLIERHDELLRLQAQVTIDLEEFVDFCRQAHDATDDPGRAAAAALALHRGEPVPTLAHHGWVAPCRHHVEERALSMHDVVAEAAARDGRLDDAIGSLLAAIAIDRLAEHRYLAVARLLAEQGRRARALRSLAEARAALTAADLEPTRELTRLEDYLQRGPVVDAAQAS